MKKLIYIIILFSYFSDDVFGQEFMWKLNTIESAFIDKLKGEGINNIGFFKYSCIGYPNPIALEHNSLNMDNPPCEFDWTNYYEIYLFWQKEDKHFVKKYDNCGEFKDVEIMNPYFFKYYKENKHIIKNEKIELFTILEPNEIGDSIKSSVVVDHSCYELIKIWTRNQYATYTINEFNLTQKSNSSGKTQNIFYENNNNLKLVKWGKTIYNIVLQLEKNRSFKR